jgi:hypothetical protein
MAHHLLNTSVWRVALLHFHFIDDVPSSTNNEKTNKEKSHNSREQSRLSRSMTRELVGLSEHVDERKIDIMKIGTD